MLLTLILVHLNALMVCTQHYFVSITCSRQADTV